MTGTNDQLLRPQKEKVIISLRTSFSYGYDLHINRMWKLLFWKPNSENLKTQNFGFGRSVGQNDHYFRSYMTQKTLVILYELLYACVF